jgi:hypothetical protein
MEMKVIILEEMQLGQSEAKERVRSKKSTWHETRTNFVFFGLGRREYGVWTKI